MSDALIKAIAEALGCEPVRYGENDDGSTLYICDEHGVDWPCDGVKGVAAALAPQIEERVREARADALTDAADAWTQGAWASTPRHKDRVADRMAASQYAGDWLRERAEEVCRG